MLNRITINMEIMESMLYYWQATKDKEKVGEAYIDSIAENVDMKAIYESDFKFESVRLVLSAISNREILNSKNKKELRFWNNNMWMLEDMDLMMAMINPLKKLNLENILKQINEEIPNFKHEEVEIVFYPGHYDSHKIIDNKIYLNFFIVKPNLMSGESMQFENLDLFKFIKNKLTELN